MIETEWICCPVCGNKTRLQIWEDTELKNFPLYCLKCKQENLIDAKGLQVTVVKDLKRKCKLINKAENRDLGRRSYCERVSRFYEESIESH